METGHLYFKCGKNIVWKQTEQIHAFKLDKSRANRPDGPVRKMMTYSLNLDFLFW